MDSAEPNRADAKERNWVWNVGGVEEKLNASISFVRGNFGVESLCTKNNWP